MRKKDLLVLVAIVTVYFFMAYLPAALAWEAPVCTNPADQRRADVSGEIIVWSDSRSGNWDIYMKDLSTGIESPLCTNPAVQYNPAVSGSVVVWRDDRNGNLDIYMRDLSTGIESPVCTNPAVQSNPAVSGSVVVWEDERNGKQDIYMKDLSTGIESPLCTNPSFQVYPAVSGSVVVWEDHRNGNWDIYMYGALNTPTGSDVKVDLGMGLSVTFSSVISRGFTGYSAGSPPSDPPSGFRFLGQAYDIATTATYSPPVTVTIAYNESEILGNESNLKLFHWDGSRWEDRATSVDTVNNTITGQVISLSPFVVGESETAAAVGYDSFWLLFTTLSLILVGLYLLRRKRERA